MAEIGTFQSLLSLSEWAMISFSGGLLKTTKARCIILNSLTNNDETLLKKIYLETARDGPHMILPKKFEKSLICVTNLMASRIFKWIKEHELERLAPSLLELYVEHFHWTNNVFVDTSESLKSMYKRKKIPDVYIAWEISCHTCSVDIIRKLWSRARTIIRVEMENRYSGTIKTQHILIIYWLVQMKTEYSSLAKLYKAFPDFVDYEKEININMFILSIIDCNYVAVQYFWNTLDNHQKTHAITQLAFPSRFEKILLKCRNPSIAERDDFTQVIIFLLQEFTHHRMERELLMVLDTSRIFKKLLHWPLQNIFIKIMKNLGRYRNTINYFSLIIEMSEFICNENANIDDMKCSEIFFETSKNLAIFEKLIDWEQLITTLFIREDFLLLKFLINNENLRDNRGHFLEIVFTLFCRHPHLENFAYRLISAVLISNEERWKFRQILLNNNRSVLFPIGPGKFQAI